MARTRTDDLMAMVASHAQSHPEDAALVCGGRRVSWRELWLGIQRVASTMAGQVVRPGDRVAILAGSSPAFMEAFLGAVWAGACAVPLPDTAPPDTLTRMVQDSGAAALAVSASRRRQADAMGKDLPVCRVALDFAEPGWIPLTDTHRPTARATPSAKAAFNIIYSSGTTGVPKGIVHSHRMRAFQVARMGRFGLGPGVVTLVSTPLYSNTSLVALLPTLALGGTVVLMPRFDAKGFLELCQQERVTHAMLVPAQLGRILDHPGFTEYDLSCCAVKWSTGAPLLPSLKQRALDCWPGKLVEIYGLTEGGCTTVLDAGAHPHRLDSVGRPARGVELKILDPQGRALPPGETGEIAGRAPSMMTGYHGRPDLTEQVSWRDDRGRVFYRTGDLGRLDQQGFLFLSGRLKDVVISGGVNIHAVDLEQVLASHPAVVEAAVIGVPSERWGETPLALVVLGGTPAVTAEELLRWANARLSKVQRLCAVEPLAGLPRNAAGKVLKGKLRAHYLRGDRGDR